MARKTSEEEKVEKARRLHGVLGYNIEEAAMNSRPPEPRKAIVGWAKNAGDV